ncbi:hypothetical protein H1235_07995 [Pseudoxanthomonas sp. NC8]|nr:hypothetical protein H1235_07995 [Pseudoxanthomonas sp. NC8]
MDSNQRNTLLNRVLGAQGRLEAKAETEANRRNTVAGRAIEQYERQVATGVPAPAEVMLDWGNNVAGTPYETEFQQIQKGELEVQQVMQLPPPEQRTYLQELKAKQQAEGATVADQGAREPPREGDRAAPDAAARLPVGVLRQQHRHSGGAARPQRPQPPAGSRTCRARSVSA